MCPYFELAPADPQLDAYVFFTDDANGRRVCRPMYAELSCPVCGKLDEDKALMRGLDPEFVVRSKRDWVGTADGQICVSPRFSELIKSLAFGGLDFVQLSSGGFWLATCSRRVSSDPGRVGFREIGRCSRCQRVNERLKGPFMEGLAVPEGEASFFAADIANENRVAAYRPVFAPQSVVKALKAAKLKGIECLEAF